MPRRSARPWIACTRRPSRPVSAFRKRCRPARPALARRCAEPPELSYPRRHGVGLCRVKQAVDLMDAAFLARWTNREAIGPLARRALGVIIRRLAAGEGALPVTDLLPDLAPGEVADAIAELDHHDLVLVEAGAVVLAYPFSARPNAFRLEPADRRPRYACCATDALGVAALMGEALTIHSRCHDCGDPLVLRTGPEGPLEPTTAMVWVGTREDIRAKACAGL